MRKIIFILVFTPILSFSQNPYYDALELKKLNPQLVNSKIFFPIPGGKHTAAAEILKNYTGGDNYGQIQTILSTNSFINLPPDASKSSNTVKGEKDFIGRIGGLNVTNVADGLAKFLVARTKQELSITFFKNFKEFLDSEQAEDFKTLFPSTEQALQVIDQEIYHFSSYLNTLREAFDKDLKNILERVPKVVENRVPNPEKEYILVALQIVNELRNGQHPAAIFENLSNHDFSDNLKPFGESLKLFKIISSSLKSKADDQYWVSADSVNLLFDKTTFRIYLGLIYQKHGDETINGNQLKIYLAQVAQLFDQYYEKYRSYIKEIANKANGVNLAMKDLKAKKSSGEKVDSYFNLFNASIELIIVSQKVNELNIGVSIGEEVTTFVDRAKIISDMYIDVNERKFNALILDLSKLFKSTLGDSFTWNDELVKYGTFIANVAQAESSDDVQSAIEAIALPVGSASIKRISKSNIALNAYVGLSPGYEYNGETEEAKWIFGVFSPVGIAFSWGHYKKKSTGCYSERGSSSLFLSIVDISAFSTFRFNDSETEQLPEVNLGNIFAPGLYYIYGIPKVPVSLGVGGQLGPQLRTITDQSAVISDGVTVSGRFFIGVDIPIINFFTKSR